jgi:hypothetical protein
MFILYLHGWQSTPGGIKPTYLKDHGHTVLNPKLPDDDFDEAVWIAQAEFDRQLPDIVVGSSRGAAVAMNINSANSPLVLLCPAWKRWGKATTVKPDTIILHSEADEVVPFSDSTQLARNSGLPTESLIAVGTEHRLADEESLKKMLEAVERALTPIQFGISTLLVVTAMYAVLFGVMRMFDASPSTFVVIAMLFTAVGLGQVLLFKGRRPRKASMVVGGGFFVGLWVIYRIAFGNDYFYHPFAPFDPVEGAFFGAMWGYVVGLLISGAFRVSRELTALCGKGHSDSNAKQP